MVLRWQEHRGIYAALFTSLLVLLAAGSIIHEMSHPLICPCGYIKLWHGSLTDSQVSQHLTDWYTASHIAHGIFIYGAMWLLTRRRPSIGLGVLLSASFAALWEVLENMPFVVNSFGRSSMVTNYAGDAVINSVGDMMATVLGFLAAAVLPIWLSPLLAAAILEFLPRDNPWLLLQAYFDY